MNTLRKPVLKPRSALALGGVSIALAASGAPEKARQVHDRVMPSKPPAEKTEPMYTSAQLADMPREGYSYTREAPALDAGILAVNKACNLYSSPNAELLPALRHYVRLQSPTGIVQPDVQYQIPELPCATAK